MILRLAIRGLLRNRGRSLLTIAGTAVAIAIVIWMTHLMEAMFDEMVRSATRAELGDIQIHSTDYIEEQALYHAFPLQTELLEQIQGLEGVEGAAARVITHGLIGNEDGSQVARLIGIDPPREAAVTRNHEKVTSGRWLSDAPTALGTPREIVLGRLLAQNLKVQPGDELAVMLQAANGSTGDDLLVVTGIVRSGNDALDRGGAWMHLADARELTALTALDFPDETARAHEIAVSVKRGQDTAIIASPIRDLLSSDELQVREWQEIVPELYQMVELSRSSQSVFYGIIYLLAALGILNAQRMTALERRREYAILAAIGTTPRRVFAQVVTESTLLSLLGGLLGALLGGALVAYHQAHGFDFGGMAEDHSGGFTYMGVTLNVLVFQFSLIAVLIPVAFATAVGALCGLWPGFSSSRLPIPTTIAGRT